MKLNTVERVAMNNPLRAAHQHHREATWFRRLAGGTLSGQRVLEIGCGRGVGVEVLLDPLMIENARRRLHDRPASAVSVFEGDVSAVELPAASVDAVVDFGIIHHVPRWREALAEITRVLRTFTDHPRQDRFEADEFADELAHHGLHGTGRIERRVGGMVFIRAARKAS